MGVAAGRGRSVAWLGMQFKEELMMAMGLNTEEEGSAMAFFRRGYKVGRNLPPSVLPQICSGR